jgi:hypothetical protein
MNYQWQNANKEGKPAIQPAPLPPVTTDVPKDRSTETPPHPHSRTPSLHHSLKLFTQTEILEQIGPRRLEKLFNTFREDLETQHLILPTPESQNGTYFDSLAATLESDAKLPDRLRNTLLALETAASPENRPLLDAAIQRRIPTVAVSQTCALDRALELWFHAPEELAAFKPNSDTQSSILNPSSCAPLTEAPSSFSLLPSSAPVDGSSLLHQLADLLKRSVILPVWAAEAIALWILHTYAFHLRDITAYIGIESPEKRCGKTTLLTLLNELAHRAIASSNISPPAFFRVIEDLSPTLLIDEVDTFLTGNDQLRGILNAGCYRKTGFVLRAAPSSGSDADPQTQGDRMGAIKRYSCWCPKPWQRLAASQTPLPTVALLFACSAKPQRRNATAPGTWMPGRSNSSASVL